MGRMLPEMLLECCFKIVVVKYDSKDIVGKFLIEHRVMRWTCCKWKSGIPGTSFQCKRSVLLEATFRRNLNADDAGHVFCVLRKSWEQLSEFCCLWDRLVILGFPMLFGIGFERF